MNNELSRRQILLLSALALATFSSIGKAFGAETAALTVEAGSLDEYAKDGVFDHYIEKGIFIIRKDGRVFAQSSVCTHKGGRLKPNNQDGFICPLHHSAFTMDGKVTRPPAKKDLVRYAVRIDDKKHLIVDMSKRIEHAQFDAPGAYVEVPSV